MNNVNIVTLPSPACLLNRGKCSFFLCLKLNESVSKISYPKLDEYQEIMLIHSGITHRIAADCCLSGRPVEKAAENEDIVRIQDAICGRITRTRRCGWSGCGDLDGRHGWRGGLLRWKKDIDASVPPPWDAPALHFADTGRGGHGAIIEHGLAQRPLEKIPDGWISVHPRAEQPDGGGIPDPILACPAYLQKHIEVAFAGVKP